MTYDSELIYRSNLEGVCNYLEKTYGDGRKMLNVKDVSTYTGRSCRTVKKRYFKVDSIIISAESFARILAKM